jgi:hypothetical protein
MGFSWIFRSTTISQKIAQTPPEVGWIATSKIAVYFYQVG